MSDSKGDDAAAPPAVVTSDGPKPRLTTKPQAGRRPTIYTLKPKKEWAPDAPTCTLCGVGFQLFRRRHHCRACGRCVCDKCSRTKMNFFKTQPKRVCDGCCAELSSDEIETRAPITVDPFAGVPQSPLSTADAQELRDAVDGGGGGAAGAAAAGVEAGGAAGGGAGGAGGGGEAERTASQDAARFAEQETEFERAWKEQQQEDARLDAESRAWRQNRAAAELPQNIMDWNHTAADTWLQDVAELPTDVLNLFRGQVSGSDLLTSLDDTFLHSGALDSLGDPPAMVALVSKKLSLLRRSHKHYLVDSKKRG